MWSMGGDYMETGTEKGKWGKMCLFKEMDWNEGAADVRGEVSGEAEGGGIGGWGRQGKLSRRQEWAGRCSWDENEIHIC